MARPATYTVDKPCNGFLKDARVAPPDLPDTLQRLANDVLLVSSPAGVEPLAARIGALIDDVEAMPVVEDVECGYDGDTDDYFFVRSVNLVVWRCPRCGHENEEDAPEPDPDAERQYARENP